MILEALQSCVQNLQEEILRLTQLAAGSSDREQQNIYYSLAEDLQREARDLRRRFPRYQNIENPALAPASVFFPFGSKMSRY